MGVWAAMRRLLLPVLGAAMLVGGFLSLDPPAPSHAAPRQSKNVSTRQVAVRAAPATVVSTAAAPAGDVVLHAPWGGAPGELGRRAANESSPEGPMSFAVAKDGSAYVLDQVNSRVSVFDRAGGATRTLPLPAETFQDIAIRDDGGVALLDRHGAESVAFLSAEGKLTHEIALAGDGVPSGGDVTALFQHDDGTWVEVQHGSLVRIADAKGNALGERDVLPGRLLPDGSAIRMSKSGARAAWLAVTPPGERAKPLVRVEFELPVLQLLALETDATGRIVIAADLAEESPEPPFALLDARETVVVLSRDGAELSRFELPAATGGEESLRRVRLGPDGSIHHMSFTENGVTVRRLGR